MAYYKVVLNGTYSQQAITNILYYRSILPTVLTLLDPTNGEDVAQQVNQEVVPEWLGMHSTEYTLNDVSVYAFDNDLQAAFAQPYTLAVNAAGLLTGNTMGPAVCAILRMNLANLPLINVLYPAETALLAPRRSYLAFGPILENDVDNAGAMVGNWAGGAPAIALVASLAQTLESITPPAIYVPVRASVHQVAGLWTIKGFAPLASVNTAPFASYRRSRRPPG